jgi:small subunit ribosomal protein S1
MGLKKEREYTNDPIQLDESWWTAVLEDVEAQYIPQPQQGDQQSEESQKLSNEKTAPSKEGPLSKGELPSKEGPSVDEIDWNWVKQLYERDQVISLKVASHNRGGLLVHGDKIQGFVPASHLIGLSKKTSKKDRDDLLSPYVDLSLQLKVIECDQERGRIVFSERAAQTDSGSRLELLNALSVGNRAPGQVTTITDFGVFVDLGGVEGLIHISELSWGRVCRPDAVVSLGDEIEVYILGIDRERIRVALSLKRLHPNPWDSVHSRYHPGQIVQAEITNIVSFGAFARLEDGLDGLIHVSEIRNRADLQDIGEIITEGQQVEVCILHIDSDQQRLGLSLHTGEDGAM